MVWNDTVSSPGKLSGQQQDFKESWMAYMYGVVSEQL